jgi:hypothetical protein
MEIGICTHCLRKEPLEKIPEIMELGDSLITIRDLIHNYRKEKQRKNFARYRSKVDYNSVQANYRQRRKAYAEQD